MEECVYYYLLDNNLKADNPKACASGFIRNGTCAPALTSQIKGRPCTSNADCISYDPSQKKLVQYGECSCGYNGGGFTYCTLSEGDEEFLDMVNKLAFIVGTSFNCHTSLRFGPCRHLYDDEYLDYQIAERYFRMYPQITFNDPCIQKVITWDYWSFLLSGPKLSHTLVHTVLIALCVVFFV